MVPEFVPACLVGKIWLDVYLKNEDDPLVCTWIRELNQPPGIWIPISIVLKLNIKRYQNWECPGAISGKWILQYPRGQNLYPIDENIKRNSNMSNHNLHTTTRFVKNLTRNRITKIKNRVLRCGAERRVYVIWAVCYHPWFASLYSNLISFFSLNLYSNLTKKALMLAKSRLIQLCLY